MLTSIIDLLHKYLGHIGPRRPSCWIDPIRVFPIRGKPINTMNNTAWQRAHHSMAGHYASADVGRLLKQANLALERRRTSTILRVAFRN